MKTKPTEQAIEAIARKHGISLKPSDLWQLNIRQTDVQTLRQMLAAAYQAGAASK